MKAFLVLDELNQFHWAMLKSVLLILALLPIAEVSLKGEFKHEVRQFQKPYDNQQAEQISLM
ncbi:hypothetical protein ITF75_15200, partial [Acinetobacter baumannii]|nr:hypothetical protein [Acinetobacter baumannii]MBP4287129.1 hypothetical protein [Acinetobacter baumannii]